jgi:Tol biopolymer transport system component
MRRITTLFTLVLLLALGAQMAPAQSGYDLYQKALVKERAEGNVEEAILLYQRIAREFAGNRALAAKAQLRLGLLYERLGRKAVAQQAFRTVVNRYPDIEDVAPQARARLAAANANNHKAASTLIVRRALGWPETYDDLYLLSAPSPNGRYLCYRDGKTLDLAVRELATGQKRRLTANQSAPPEARGYPQLPIFAPDSKQVAYIWTNRDRSQELRVIGLDGSGMRTLYRSEEVTDIVPAEWSWDGRQILALFRHKESGYQIVSVTVADGAAQVLKTQGRLGSEKLSFSPDGRYVAYDFRPREDVRERDISLLATDGGSEASLIAHPAHDRLLGWAPDGKSIFFGSDRAGAMGAWIIRVADGLPQGEPEMVKPDLGRIFPMGFTRAGAYYYGQEVTNVQSFTAALDFATGKLLIPATPLLRRSHGPFASPNFSPDGQYLAYGSVRSLTPWKPGSDVITIRALATGKERELMPDLEYFDLFGWSPDGRSLLLGGREINGARGLYKVDVSAGDLTMLWLTDPKAGWIQQAEWSPDGKTIFYRWENCLLARELATGQERELYRGPVLRFALSPDGQRLAIAQGQSLKLMPAAGGEARDLLTAQRPEWIVTVAWTPDGRQLLFGKSNISQQGQPSELWRLAAEGGEPQRLELTVEGLRELRAHPDGQRLAFSSFQMRREVWTMENFLKPAPDRKNSSRR